MTRHHPRAFTIVETVFSMFVVSLMLAASLNVAAFSKLSQSKQDRRVTADALADSLLAEMVALAYKDPADVVSGVPSASGRRDAFNDVTDYKGLNEDTPRTADGTPIPKMTGWTRHVALDWVLGANLETTSGSDTGFKRVRITVKYLGTPLASRTAIRTPVL